MTGVERTADFALNGVARGEVGASYFIMKRLVDVCGALVLLLLLLPLFLIVGVAILADCGWPVFYRGERIGQGGRPFRILKFRSMCRDADPNLHRRYILELMRGAASTGVHKVPNDPRVTRTGRILRKTSIDELPQLWNVLRGDMSLVGPRPDVPYCVEAYEPWMRRRLDARPGMTGLWQVSGRSVLGLREMLELDVRYVDQRSLLLDAQLLLRTVPAVLALEESA